MSGSTLRRTVLCFVVVALLLPLASAWAAPARERDTARIQLLEWSRILLAPLGSLLDLFRPAVEADTRPPGHHPGNNHPGNNHPGNDQPTSQGREGNGFDPHGRP